MHRILLPALVIVAQTACVLVSSDDGGRRPGRDTDTDVGTEDSDPVTEPGPTDTDPVTDVDPTGTTEPTGPCGVPPERGSFYGTVPPSLVTTAPYTHDSNLDAVVAAAPATIGETISGLSLPVTGAIVTNTGSNATTLVWLGDGNAAVRTYLSPPLASPAFPGDEVSFTVTEVMNYFGELEITGLTGWTVLSSGNPVLVRDGHGVPLDYGSMGRINHETWGQLTGDLGACGGTSNCWELTHGGIVSELRASTDSGLGLGDCVHVVAPVNYYAPRALYDLFDLGWADTF